MDNNIRRLEIHRRAHTHAQIRCIHSLLYNIHKRVYMYVCMCFEFFIIIFIIVIITFIQIIIIILCSGLSRGEQHKVGRDLPGPITRIHFLNRRPSPHHRFREQTTPIRHVLLCTSRGDRIRQALRIKTIFFIDRYS